MKAALRTSGVVLALVLLTGMAGASIVNGGFETGDLTGWTALPSADVSVVTSAVGDTPTDGTFQALLVTPSDLGDGNIVALSTFAGLNLLDLFSLGNGAVLQGTAIQQTFTVTAGQTVYFDYNFLTNAPLPQDAIGFDNDFGFAVIGGLNELSDSYDASNVSATAFDWETGYQTFSHTFALAGTYTLTIGVADTIPIGGAASDYGSGLLVDNVRFGGGAVVPEPATMSLLGMGISGLVLRRLRKNK